MVLFDARLESDTVSEHASCKRHQEKTRETRVHFGQRLELGLNYLLVGSSGTRKTSLELTNHFDLRILTEFLQPNPRIGYEMLFFLIRRIPKRMLAGQQPFTVIIRKRVLAWRSRLLTVPRWRLTALVLKKALTYLWRPTIGKGRPSTSTSNHLQIDHQSCGKAALLFSQDDESQCAIDNDRSREIPEAQRESYLSRRKRGRLGQNLFAPSFASTRDRAVTQIV